MSERTPQTQPFGTTTAQAMAQSSAGYIAFDDLGGASALESEILAFGLCITRLANAKDRVARIHALHKNQQLWSMLVRDLAGHGNHLPDYLKQQLIELGFWSMRYGIMAGGHDLPLDPLIAVNSNILDGLRAQRSATAPLSPRKTISGGEGVVPPLMGLNASA